MPSEEKRFSRFSPFSPPLIDYLCRTTRLI
jgi:hypothetical protein